MLMPESAFQGVVMVCEESESLTFIKGMDGLY